MKVLSVSLQKGGVGKSTITANLAVGMSKIIGERERILVVDMDHQGNLTYQMLGNPSDVEKTAIELFTPGEKYKATDIVHNTRFKNIEIIPSNLALSKAELYTSQIIDAHNRLAQYLKQVVFMYDYVFIDCPPSLGLLTLNALIASDYVLIPVVPEKYATMAITQMMDTIKMARAFNEKLQLAGIVPSIVDMRYRIHRATMKTLETNFGNMLLKDKYIGTNAPLKDAANRRQTIFEYDNRAASYKHFQNLASYVHRLMRITENEKRSETA